MSNKKNILILCSDNYDKQPRVLRTIEALKTDYAIMVAGYSDSQLHQLNFTDLAPNLLKNKTQNWHFNKPFFIRLLVSFYYKFIKQKQFSKTLYYESQYWNNARKADLVTLQKIPFDIIISHGVDMLPMAIKLANHKVPVIFNAHEYYPLEFEQDKIWLKTEGAKSSYIIDKYLPKCTKMFCVSENIQKEYQKKCKIDSVVITNATKYIDLKINKTNSIIKIIHHGAAIRARQIELMIEMMNYLSNDFILHLMLTPSDPNYLAELKKLHNSNNRIEFIDPVNVAEIPQICNQYDIGLFILPPVNFNWVNALPNKLFEFIQARLSIAVSPNSDMKYLVEKYNLGVVSDDYSPESMAKKIMTLTPTAIDKYKLNSHNYAMELSAEENQKKILEIVNAQFLN
ncbi:MAG: glycosyltransferase [Bacteroidota bacterium]|nr:glycosyltransferase [Bacteroidota bacterium]